MKTPSILKKKSPPSPHDASLLPAGKRGVGLDFVTDDVPQPGEVRELAEGVFWLRFALPMTGLNHINLYAIRDGDGWVVVDTGIAMAEAKRQWEGHFRDLMGGRPINRVICTHLHPDHTGLAGWICRKFGAPLLMTRGEYFLCRLLVADTGHPAPMEGIKFYQKAGFTPEQIELYKTRFGGFGKAVSELPHAYDRLTDGEWGQIGGRTWRIIIGSGH
ncbi:MAG: MBL fold metallo-hydrolase, partial [Litorimonas sp.]